MDVRPQLLGLLEYTGRMATIGERAVFRLADYRGLLYHEQALRHRVGITHDVAEGEERVWLRIDRLSRRDPPPVPDEISVWVAIGRDPFKEPTVQATRVVTVPTAEVATLIASGRAKAEDVAPAMKDRDGIAAAQLRDVVLRMENDPKSTDAVRAYVEGTWSAWAAQEKPRRETIRIYEAFFSLQQTIETQGVERPLELVWGVGVVRWRHTREEFDHPILEQLVEIEIDPEGGAIRVIARSAEPMIALRPYQELGIDGADRLQRFAREHFRKVGSETEFSPFVKATFEPVLRQAAALLDAEGRYHPDHQKDINDRAAPPAGPILTITDTWAIFARPRSANIVVEDIERLKSSVERTEPNELPAAAVRLVSTPDSKRPESATTLPLTLGVGISTPSLPEAASAPASAYFFPKPFNAEQIEIAQRLEHEDGVVVQGPPGTGKTHTIANIVCHYMATGRRVLIVSHGEAALGVLRDQIPPEIRELAISLLTSERQGLKLLEKAVRVLADDVSQQSAKQLKREIDEGERRVIALKDQIARVELELRRWAELHLKPLGGGKGMLPMELARRVVEGRSRFGWFEDRPSVEQPPGLSDQDIARLRAARRKVGQNLCYVGVPLPAPNDLLDPARLAAIHEDLANADAIAEQSRSGELPPLSMIVHDALTRAESLIGVLDGMIVAHEARASEPWLAVVFDLTREGHSRPETEAFDRARNMLERAVEGRRRFLSTTIDIPEHVFSNQDLLLSLRDALRRQTEGQSPFSLFSFTQRKIKAIYAELRVNEAPIGDADAAQASLDYIKWRRVLRRLRQQWNRLAPEIGLPLIEHEGEAVGRWAADIHGKIMIQIVAARDSLPTAMCELPELFPFGLKTEGIVDRLETVRRAREVVANNLTRRRLEASRAQIADLGKRLAAMNAPLAREMGSFLDAVGSNAYSGQQVAAYWESFLDRLRYLREMAPEFESVTSATAKIADTGAPRWAERLRREPVEGTEDPLTPGSWREAWMWAQQEGYLRRIDGRQRLAVLSRERLTAAEDLERIFRQVVRARTFLALHNNMSDLVRASLMMFVAAIKKIGAGTGIKSRRFRRDARDAMDKSYSAVPCWIMPTWRVSESLPSVLGSFDLVIIDEASQSDMLALPAILRGRKVLVVGDDKQVSPLAVGVEEKKILQLRHNYLEGQPFAPMLLPGSSLYDLMGAVFPGQRIMLKEHFRCVEPIIRFSAREFYDNQIRPLRIPKPSERLDPPLIDILVEGGWRQGKVNLPEAEVIVAEIERIVSDPAFANRSIGVISLVGAQQAQKIQTMLLERIGEKRYVHHQIACGDSATFQGKERDIMFLSMVDVPSKKSTKTGLVYQQRYNVALSRARDRMYLVRSVDEPILKPDDLNARVIRHFRDPMERAPVDAGDAIALCESGFEREVYTCLAERGWRVRPQVSAGDYRIDLVVEGIEDRRLAIELDGDTYHGVERWAEDHVRQVALERMNWRFWRCWASSWTLDQAGCLADLEATLRSMGIEPIGREGRPARYTEHRVVGRSSDNSAEVRAPLASEISATAIIDEARAANSQDRAHAEKLQAMNGGLTAAVVDHEDRIVEPGDRVVLMYNDEPTRQRTIVLTTDESANDPDMGIVYVKRPIALALIGCEEGEVVDLPAAGRLRQATILSVDKPRVDA